MRIVIASAGRAHILDCARELQKQGHEITYYTITPPKNLRIYGLEHGGVSLFFWLAPFIAMARFLPSDFTRRIQATVLDFVVSKVMPECDVFIGQSPHYPRSIKTAKDKYGAKTILDRGTSHVRIFNYYQELVGYRSMTERYMKEDESHYQLADYIAIASDFVKEGFIEKGISEKKLFVNPYGVALNNFKPTACTNEYDFILVGQWTKRKGSHLVVDAFKNTNYKILHVGPVMPDIEFPDLPNFTHVDPVKEYQLADYYAKSKVFLFPSIEDGFGLVLCQAAACGLPIVSSPNTGGPTLKRMLNNDSNIRIMNAITAESLYEEAVAAIASIDENRGMRQYQNSISETMSWGAYGNRYDVFLKEIVK